jgi:hypothetical protein
MDVLRAAEMYDFISWQARKIGDRDSLGVVIPATLGVKQVLITGLGAGDDVKPGKVPSGSAHLLPAFRPSSLVGEGSGFAGMLGVHAGQLH